MAKTPKPQQLPLRPIAAAGKPVSPGYRIAVVACVLFGGLLWIDAGAGRGVGAFRWVLIAAAGAIGFLPFFARRLEAALDRIRHPAPRTLRRASLLIFLAAAAYFVLTAFNQGRDLFPKTHDDCSYAIGIQMLARGRLWEPPLPLPDFFDSFYLLVRPVYASIYFPGAAMLYVPTVWLHLPDWMMPAMASGAVVAMMYRIIAEVIDGVAAALAAILVASSSWFRVYSVLLTSHIPMLLMGLVLIFAWMRWRKRHGLGWATAIGTVAGWAAITRPADAVVFALPVGIAIAWELLRRRTVRGWATPILIIAGALPFLTVQLIFDRGVTGNALYTPYAYYLKHDQPGSQFGFHPYDATARPDSSNLAKQENYAGWVRPYLSAHTPGKVAGKWAAAYFPMIVEATMPCRLMLLFAPIGLLGLFAPARRVLGATFPLFLFIYAFNPFFLEHYAIIAIPSVALLIVLGGQALANAFPRVSGEIYTAFFLIVCVASLTSFWEINRYVATAGTQVDDETFPSDYLHNAHQYLADAVDKPAVVLFSYHPGDNYFAEPVYNTDVAWPDDAPVIRAHDLGPVRNREIFAYYAKTQPQRTFYLFDWSKRQSPEGVLRRLGRAPELAASASR